MNKLPSAGCCGYGGLDLVLVILIFSLIWLNQACFNLGLIFSHPALRLVEESTTSKDVGWRPLAKSGG